MKLQFSFIKIAVTLSLVFFSKPSAKKRSFPGITEPYQNSTISSTISGRISNINLKEGSLVKKGAVILELEADVERYESLRRKLIAESKVELEISKKQMQTLKQDYEATKLLFDSSQSVSKEELWKKDLDYKKAQAEYEQLKLNEERESLEHKIANAKLQKRRIQAPFSGIVVKHYLEKGESCKAQEPLVKIVNIHKVRFITHIRAESAQGIKKGNPVNLKLGKGASIINVNGLIDYVSPIVDPSSGLREVKVLFDNPKGEFAPGISGTMTLGGAT